MKQITSERHFFRILMKKRDINEEPVHIVPKLIMSYKSEYDTSLYIQFKMRQKEARADKKLQEFC